jgi:hypothetical protein
VLKPDAYLEAMIANFHAALQRVELLSDMATSSSTPHFNDMIAARGGKGAGAKKAAPPPPKASPKIPAPPMAPNGC